MIKKSLLTGLLIYGFVTASVVLAQSEKSDHFTLHKLADGVYAAIHQNGGAAVSNAGVIDLGEDLVIFDTFLSHTATRELIAAMKRVSGKPIRYVINSHYHSDHTWGNQLFGDSVTIISSAKTRMMMPSHLSSGHPDSLERKIHQRIGQLKAVLQDTVNLYRYSENLRSLGYYKGMLDSYRNLKITMAGLTFDTLLTLYGSKRTARLVNTNSGSTGGDVYLYLQDDRILFTGDLVFSGMHPYLMESDPDQFIGTLTGLLSLDVKTVVPGHGEIGDTSLIHHMIRYIESVVDVAQAKHQSNPGNIDLDDVTVPAPYRQWHYHDIYKMNVKFVYDRFHSR